MQSAFVGKCKYTPLSTGKKSISRITLTDSADNQFTYGNDSGIELAAGCEYATQEMVERIGASYSLKSGILRFIEVGTSGQHHAVAAGQRYQTAGGRTPGNPVFALLYPVCDRISIPAFQPAKRLYASRFRDGFVCVRTHGDGQSYGCNR